MINHKINAADAVEAAVVAAARWRQEAEIRAQAAAEAAKQRADAARNGGEGAEGDGAVGEVDDSMTLTEDRPCGEDEHNAPLGSSNASMASHATPWAAD